MGCLTKLIWNDFHNGFIMDGDWNEDFPEKISPKPIGNPFLLDKIKDFGGLNLTLVEKREYTLTEYLSENFPEANSYCEGTVSKNGFFDTIYQAYKI